VEEQSFDRSHLQESIARILKTEPELEQALAKATSTRKQHVESSKAIFQSLRDIIMILEKFHKGKAMNQAKEPMRPEPKSILPRGTGQGDDVHLEKGKSQIDVEGVRSSELLMKRTGRKDKRGKEGNDPILQEIQGTMVLQSMRKGKEKIDVHSNIEEVSLRRDGIMLESTEDEIGSTEDDHNSDSGESENSDDDILILQETQTCDENENLQSMLDDEEDTSAAGDDSQLEEDMNNEEDLMEENEDEGDERPSTQASGSTSKISPIVRIDESFLQDYRQKTSNEKVWIISYY
jgi:hypothetical protein